MNRKLVFLTALVAGLIPVAAAAQVSPALPEPATPAPQAAPAPPAPADAAAQPAPPVPEAYAAKIALVDFRPAVINTNEGLRAVEEIQKKYGPKKTQLDQLAAEIETLKKQVDATPSTLTQEERASKLKTIDTKEKQLNRDGEDAQTAYTSDLQDAYNKIAPKVASVMQAYALQKGFTLVLDVSNEQTQVMWALQSPSSDITEAVIDAYNKSSGITPPPPAAPAPAAKPKPAPTAPHTTAPTTPAPHTTTPKPPQ